ncbi:U5 small nuclear ribonucleoprotein TSSC4 [Tribolium castaneum]|uniref:U5 small nuclear ribonucleoprotein TSSC4 n=1 Tax=Tribolium castaneum TaxID=7070 RepID=D6W6F8_TRICA|nr:PREDICTED: protein TSSC4 [Tribolium castaneum]EFA11351.1 Protein TSSC4-like Protein [Tribolium castaneum]|eukprot:XP_971610.1 PREDICTED: protein TSSC4 [Tribolium castaneum]
MDKPDLPFMLKNSNKNFMERQKSIFDQLSTLTCNLQKDEEMEVEGPKVSNRANRSVMRQFRGKESIFKRPQDPVSKNYMRTIPDFKKNPHKWTKYSLADVKDEDMSDRSNTKAALSFLNELKNRNSEMVTDKSEEMKKIVFKKVHTTTVKDNLKSEDEKPSFRSSKVVMPEYVVGQKVKKDKKNKKIQSGGGGQLKLDHLLDGDE